MIDNSHATFMKVPLEDIFKVEWTNHMDLDRPCVLILGGENTNCTLWTHNYCKSIARALYSNNIKSGLDIYSACYKLDNRDSGLDRLNLFREFRSTQNLLDYGNGLTMTDLTYMTQSYPLSNTYPSYIYDIFNFAFTPRLLGNNNQLIDTKTIKQNLRNMIVFTHCHGAYILRMIEKYMQQESNKYTYSLQDMYNIQKNVLAINHAPFAPLEECKFSAVSFASASDTQISYYNELNYNMKNYPDLFSPAFFGPEFGNIMITNQIKKDIFNEHSQVGLSGTKEINKTLTKNGTVLFATERNALIQGTQAMLAGTPIPTTEELISAPDMGISFKQFQKNGQKICKKLKIKTR